MNDTGLCLGGRGKVVCQVPSSAAHVSHVSYSPDNCLVALSADKLVHIVDVKVLLSS